MQLCRWLSFDFSAENIVRQGEDYMFLPGATNRTVVYFRTFDNPGYFRFDTRTYTVVVAVLLNDCYTTPGFSSWSFGTSGSPFISSDGLAVLPRSASVSYQTTLQLESNMAYYVKSSYVNANTSIGNKMGIQYTLSASQGADVTAERVVLWYEPDGNVLLGFNSTSLKGPVTVSISVQPTCNGYFACTAPISTYEYYAPIVPSPSICWLCQPPDVFSGYCGGDGVVSTLATTTDTPAATPSAMCKGPDSSHHSFVMCMLIPCLIHLFAMV
eukprot:m.146295 g.146295  ORF g.146295 m.146295 type:complete len:270 (+) comp16235_c0_seq10:1149-1958(+)